MRSVNHWSSRTSGFSCGRNPATLPVFQRSSDSLAGAAELQMGPAHVSPYRQRDPKRVPGLVSTSARNSKFAHFPQFVAGVFAFGDVALGNDVPVDDAECLLAPTHRPSRPASCRRKARSSRSSGSPAAAPAGGHAKTARPQTASTRSENVIGAIPFMLRSRKRLESCLVPQPLSSILAPLASAPAAGYTGIGYGTPPRDRPG